MIGYAAPLAQDGNAAERTCGGRGGGWGGGCWRCCFRASAIAAWARTAPGWPVAAALAMFWTWRAAFGLWRARRSRAAAPMTCLACGFGLPLVSSVIASSWSVAVLSSSALAGDAASGARAAPGDPPPFLRGRQASGRVAYSASAVVLSTPFARFAVVFRTLTPAPPSARAGAGRERHCSLRRPSDPAEGAERPHPRRERLDRDRIAGEYFVAAHQVPADRRACRHQLGRGVHGNRAAPKVAAGELDQQVDALAVRPGPEGAVDRPTRRPDHRPRPSWWLASKHQKTSVVVWYARVVRAKRWRSSGLASHEASAGPAW